MRYFIYISLVLLLTSCGVYQIKTQSGVKISKVLTITSTGDTLAVPLKIFQKYNYNNLFDNYRFNYNFNNWGMGNYPYYRWNPNYLSRPNSWYYRDFYHTPSKYNTNPIIKQKNKSYIKGRRRSTNIKPNIEFNRNYNKIIPRENPNTLVPSNNKRLIPNRPNNIKPLTRPNNSNKGVKGNSNIKN